jgi:lysophospholipase L1-like esterase
LALAVLIGLGGTLAAAPGPAKVKKPTKTGSRIVFLGDSITDGNTYPLLVQQALAEANRPVPVCINAGVAGDTAQGMRKRLRRDVLVCRPTLVTLSVGINDVLRKIKPADYEADVTAIAEQLQKVHIPMLILTTSILGPKYADADKQLGQYNAFLRGLAKKHHWALADVNKAMQTARTAGKNVLEKDQVHPNFEGQRVMASTVLRALGYPEVALPREMKVRLMPGILRDWRLRPVTDKEPALDEKRIGILKPDSSWKTYLLPDRTALANWWLDQERKRGFALGLDRKIGPGKAFQGIAYLDVKRPHSVYFNTGAQLQTIWLNGKRIYKNEGWTGWHAGKERIKAPLKAGRNIVVIETGSDFFLSVTKDNTW